MWRRKTYKHLHNLASFTSTLRKQKYASLPLDVALFNLGIILIVSTAAVAAWQDRRGCHCHCVRPKHRICWYFHYRISLNIDFLITCNIHLSNVITITYTRAYLPNDIILMTAEKEIEASKCTWYTNDNLTLMFLHYKRFERRQEESLVKVWSPIILSPQVPSGTEVLHRCDQNVDNGDTGDIGD